MPLASAPVRLPQQRAETIDKQIDDLKLEVHNKHLQEFRSLYLTLGVPRVPCECPARPWNTITPYSCTRLPGKGVRLLRCLSPSPISFNFPPPSLRLSICPFLLKLTPAESAHFAQCQWL